MYQLNEIHEQDDEESLKISKISFDKYQFNDIIKRDLYFKS